MSGLDIEKATLNDRNLLTAVTPVLSNWENAPNIAEITNELADILTPVVGIGVDQTATIKWDLKASKRFIITFRINIDDPVTTSITISDDDLTYHTLISETTDAAFIDIIRTGIAKARYIKFSTAVGIAGASFSKLFI